MNYQQIKSIQIEQGIWPMQEWINSGAAWRLEGSVGREASYFLEIGACMLPKTSMVNAYGGVVPSRDMVEKGSKGSFQNSVKYYSNYKYEEL